MPPNENRPPTRETGPDNTIANTREPSSRPRQIAVSCDEPWVLLERRALREALDLRIELWLALGLRVRDDSHDMIVARAIASVDRILRRAS